MPCALVPGGCEALRQKHCAMEFLPARGLCAGDGPNGMGLHDLSFKRPGVKRITRHAANGFAAGGVTLLGRWAAALLLAFGAARVLAN